MSYVDGFVVPVPRKNLAAYRRMAQKAGKVWKEYGALEYKEWISDDVKVGKLTSFPRSVKLKAGETVVTDGQLRLLPGMKAEPRQPSGAPIAKPEAANRGGKT